MIKESYIKYVKNHKDSKGNTKPYTIISHKTNKILGSYSSKEEAEKALKRMHYFKHKESFIGINSLDKIIKEAAAPTVAELYRNYVYKKQIFTSEEFNSLVNSDPTYIHDSSKIGSYVLWLIKIFKNEPYKILEDSYKVKQYLEIFDKIKKRLPVGQKKIEEYAGLPELFEVVKPYIDKDLDSDSQLRRKVEKEKDNIEEVFDNDSWKVVIPKSYEASCYWGAGTQWCTATRERRTHYDNYNKQGSLFIIINKKDPEEKYQYHMPSGSLMDASDSHVSMQPFIRSFFEVNDPDYKEMGRFLSEELQEIAHEDYSDKYYEAETKAYHKELEELDNELYNFTDKFVSKDLKNVPEDLYDYIPSDTESTIYYPFLKEKVLEIIGDGEYFSFVVWSGYMDWDRVWEDLKKEYFAEILAKLMEEYNQGKFLEKDKAYKEHERMLEEEGQESYNMDFETILKTAEKEISEKDVPKKELEKGKEIEKEHKDTITELYNELADKDPSEKDIEDAAENISLDHEIETIDAVGEPVYYEDYLIPMEKEMKKESCEKSIIEFFEKNPDPSDSQIHNFAEEHGKDPDYVEEEIYALLTKELEKGSDKTSFIGINSLDELVTKEAFFNFKNIDEMNSIQEIRDYLKYLKELLPHENDPVILKAGKKQIMEAQEKLKELEQENSSLQESYSFKNEPEEDQKNSKKEFLNKYSL